MEDVKQNTEAVAQTHLTVADSPSRDETIREDFAARAMLGMLNNRSLNLNYDAYQEPTATQLQNIASLAVAMADDLIAALNDTPEPEPAA